jgi:hypothetical protein
MRMEIGKFPAPSSYYFSWFLFDYLISLEKSCEKKEKRR